ncbi:MAG TPA: hypothetical protein VEA63_01565, partial [Opitutus sp.]|nr:hypothetical protein [Opitutus sp.]
MDTNGHEWGRRWITAVAGLVVGGLVVALLPERVLFVHDERVVQEEVTGERWACPMMDFIGNKPGE